MVVAWDLSNDCKQMAGGIMVLENYGIGKMVLELSEVRYSAELTQMTCHCR